MTAEMGRGQMIKVRDIAYGRFRVPDLDVAETFLLDFGMVRSARTDTALYMRGTDPHHHLYIAELGEPEYVGTGYYADSEQDLAIIATADGAGEIEDIDEPGGGKRVCLTDPEGFQVEIVHGIESVDPLPVSNLFDRNFGTAQSRKGDLVRLQKGPAQVKRCGHVVLNVSDPMACDAWYKEHLGFISSDEMYDGDEDNVVFTFNRLDRGKEFVDHHVLLTVPRQPKGLGHLAFEVEDVNAVYLGHEWLKAKGYKHSWGIGRHIYGSQIFDYWYDPFDFRVEHWTDGDLLNADIPPNREPANEALKVQWGTGPEFRLE